MHVRLTVEVGENAVDPRSLLARTQAYLNEVMAMVRRHLCGNPGPRQVSGWRRFFFENGLQLFSTCAMVANPEILRGPSIGTYLEANQKKHGLR